MDKQAKEQELLNKIIETQEQLKALRQELDQLNYGDRKAVVEALVGKAFKLNTGDKGSTNEYNWMQGSVFINGYTEDLQPYGVKVSMIESDNSITGHWYTIEINHPQHLDWILNGEEIPLDDFKKLYEEADSSAHVRIKFAKQN